MQRIGVRVDLPQPEDTLIVWLDAIPVPAAINHLLELDS